MKEYLGSQIQSLPDSYQARNFVREYLQAQILSSPPAGANLVTTIVRRHTVLNLQHHDQASLLSGKLHAVLQRSYLKGRDIYDLLWYLSDPAWPAPNFTMLNNALQQTGWNRDLLNQNTWRDSIRDYLEKANWDDVIADVRPFVESPQELAMLNKESLLSLLG